MAIGPSGLLGIELGTHQIRVIHGAVTERLLRVYDYVVEEIFGENSAQQLEALVEREGFRSFPAALTLCGPGVAHRLLDFPPMPASELALVLGREMRALGGTGEEMVFDWEVIGESEAGSLRQIRVLVAIAPKAQVEVTQQLLAQSRLKPALFTTVPIALLRSLSFVQWEKRGLHAILYMGLHQGYLLGVKDGVWSFYREFSSREEEGLLEEAVREANRALQYHHRSYREEEEMKFLLCGKEGLEELEMRLERETGVYGEVMEPGPGLDLSPLKERVALFRNLFPSLIVPLGLISAVYMTAGVNLVPKAVRRSISMRPRLDLSFVRQPLSAVIVLLVFFGVHLMLVHTERHYQRFLEERARLYSEWLPAIQAAEESRGLRENEKLLAQSLGRTRISEPDWVLLFKTLSRLAHPDLVLQSVSFQRDKERWLVTFKGEVVSRDAYTAQAAFNHFYQGLKGSAYLEQIELLPLNVTTFKEKVAGPAKRMPEEPEGRPSAEIPAAEMEIKKTKVEFELRGQAKET